MKIEAISGNYHSHTHYRPKWGYSMSKVGDGLSQQSGPTMSIEQAMETTLQDSEKPVNSASV